LWFDRRGDGHAGSGRNRSVFSCLTRRFGSRQEWLGSGGPGGRGETEIDETPCIRHEASVERHDEIYRAGFHAPISHRGDRRLGGGPGGLHGSTEGLAARFRDGNGGGPASRSSPSELTARTPLESDQDARDSSGGRRRGGTGTCVCDSPQQRRDAPRGSPATLVAAADRRQAYAHRSVLPLPGRGPERRRDRGHPVGNGL